jgi:hypothetical protein
LDPATTHTAVETRLKWPQSVADKRIKDLDDYFYLMYPIKGLTQTVHFTSLNLASKDLPGTSHGEIIKFIGMRLAMTCMPSRGGLKSYWNREQQRESVCLPLNFFGRFGMT